MDSADELKAEIDALEPHERPMLAEWFRAHRRWKLGLSNRCFVIMPFSKTKCGRDEAYWTAFFEKFLKPALEQCGYQAERSVAAQDNIVENIIQELAWADLVVAVLTDFNVNVCYELGVRHSLRLGTVLVCATEDIKRIPFDLKHHGFADYGTFDVNHPEAAIEAFVAQLKTRRLLENAREELPDNPVATFMKSGLVYCVSKALAGRRKVIGMLNDAILAGGGEDEALNEVDRLNHNMKSARMQVTIVKADSILRHQISSQQGTAAEKWWFDMTRNGMPLYPEMKALGSGLRLGSISGCEGRVTAIAFDQMPSQGWMVVFEAHVYQAELSA